MKRWRHALLASVLVLTAAACSDDASSTTTTPTTPDTVAPETVAPDTVAPETLPVTDDTVAPAAGWEEIAAPPDCMCSGGEPYSFFVKQGDPEKVVFFLEGGGACFDATTCAPGGPYKTTVDDPSQLSEGVFDETDERNPFAGWSWVYVPYCTGDVHLGNTTTDYGNGVVVEHKGFINASAALETMAETFPDAQQVVVTGESAGSVPTPLYAGMASDLLPDARITVLADGSGAYPDVPAINAVIGGAWGTENAIPDWPENEGLTAADWSFPDLFVQAGKHAPDIVFARHDYAFDQTQTFFAGLAGIPADDLVSLIDANEAQIEAGGTTLWSWISPGDSHTVLHSPDFYTETVDGKLFVDWVRALVAGEPVEDVHCTQCQGA